jgi:DNA-binding SARP family transcriptional activator
VIERRVSDELAALLDGAVLLSRAGNRIGVIVALLSAIGVAPDDLTAHRRLAAAFAVAGDREGARAEYDRFIARLEARGAFDEATIERSYAAVVLAPPVARPPQIAAPAHRRLTAEQAVAIRHLIVAVVAIVATLAAMLVAGAEIFARGG